VGYGVFTLDKSQEQTTLPDARAGGMTWLLSRYHPRNEQEVAGLLAPAAAYRLTSVAGWLGSPDGPAQRRKRVYLLEEGSWLQVNEGAAGDSTLLGDLVNVAPEYADSASALPHPVYRAGFGVAIGLAKEVAHG
jgi:CRISPR-associated protein Csm4